MQEFHEELKTRAAEVEKLLKSLPMSTPLKGGKSGRTTPGRPSTGRSDSPAVVSPVSMAANAAALQRKWTIVSQMSYERNKKLIDMYNRLFEVLHQRHILLSQP